MISVKAQREKLYDFIENNGIKEPTKYWSLLKDNPAFVDIDDEVKQQVAEENWGFGPIIAPLVNESPDVTDIRLTSPTQICVKRGAKRERIQEEMTPAQYDSLVKRILDNNKKNVTPSNAIRIFSDAFTSPACYLRYTVCDASINDSGYKSVFIRKTFKEKKTFDELLKHTELHEPFCTKEEAEFLIKEWEDGKNILVVGPNGSGKTTFINALIDYTNKARSAIVIQESKELFCDTHPEMIFRQMSNENTGIQNTLEDICRAALTESFDTFIVGEVKGGEAAQLGYAMYTGGQGLASTHGISAKDGVERIIDYCLEAESTRSRAHFLKQFANLNYVVYIENYKIKEILRAKFNNKEMKFTPVFEEEAEETNE